MRMYYIKKKLITHQYFLLLIIIPPLLLTRTRTNAIISVVLFIITVLMWVSTRWSIKIKKLFQYKKVRFPDYENENLYIFYKNHLLKINKNRTFVYLNEIFHITTMKEEGLIASNKNDIYSENINKGNLIERGYKIQKVQVNTNKTLSEMVTFEYLNGDTLIPKAIEKELYEVLGKNIQEISPPEFLEILIDHLLSPFFLLTIFSSILWLFDDYFYTTITNFILSIFMEIGNAYQKYSNLNLFTKKEKNLIDFQLIDPKEGEMVLGEDNIPNENPIIKTKKEIEENLLNVLETEAELSETAEVETEVFSDLNKNHFQKLLTSQPTLTKNSQDLKPGDVIILNESDILTLKKFPCDFLLLNGTVVVNESLLTGESIPISKTPLFSLNNESEFLNEELKNLKQSTVFGGSTLLTTTNNTRLMVLNIGFSTESGRLMSKMILKDNVNINYKDSATFISLLLFIGSLGCIYLIKQYFITEKFKAILFTNEKLTDFCIKNIYKQNNLKKVLSKLFDNSSKGINPKGNNLLQNISKCSCYNILKKFQIKKFFNNFNDLLIDILMLITNIVPCELPLELSMSINNCVSQLLTKKVYVVEPSKLENAGDIDIICLDKTGTITEDTLLIKGIWLSDREDEKSIEVLAACHELISIKDPDTNEYTIIGDPIDKAISEHLETEIINNKTIYEETSIEILKRFPFTSEKRIQSCLVSINNKTYYVCKGALEEILKKCDTKTYSLKDEKIYKHQSSLGLRILAFCYKEVSSNNDTVELISKMKYSGLILMENPIKDGCIEEIQTLKNEGYKVIMITGDSKLTAKAIASKVGILSEDTGNQIDKQADGEEILKLLTVKESCLNLLKKISVFSRVSPKIKEEIIKAFQLMNLNCLMVGDGTNDVGALKESKVGIALLTSAPLKQQEKRTKTPLEKQEEKIAELKAKLGILSLDTNESNMIGDASMAAPISTRYGLKTISLILSYGRSLKITNLQMYKILSINAVIFAMFWILDAKSIIFGDKQMVITSFLMSIAFMALTFQNPVTLSKESKRDKPIKAPKIRSLYTFSTILLQIIIHIITFYYSFKVFDKRPSLKDQIGLLQKIKSICTPLNLNTLEETEEILDLISDTVFQPSKLNTLFFILTQYLQIQTFLINYVGRPFRENLLENRKLFFSLISCVGFLLAVLFNFNIELNSLVECVTCSMEDIKELVKIMGLNGLLCYLVDRVSLYLLN